MNFLKPAMTLLVFANLIGNAYSGEGRNGPDQSGEAIPVSLDREVTVEELQGIFDGCYKSYLQETFASMLDTDVTSEDICNYSSELQAESTFSAKCLHNARNNINFERGRLIWAYQATSTFNVVDTGITINGYIDKERAYRDDLILKENDSLKYIKHGKQNFHIALVSTYRNPFYGDVYEPIILSKSSEEIESGLVYNELVPNFVFTPEIVESSFDIYGRLQTGRKVARNIKIINRDIKSFKLRNAETGYFGLSVDLSDVGRCLENGVANL